MNAGKREQVRRRARGRYNLRQLRGLGIIATGNQITRVRDDLYIVKSQSGPGEYKVQAYGSVWGCDCSDFEKNQDACKHIESVRFASMLLTIVRSNLPAISECAEK